MRDMFSTHLPQSLYSLMHKRYESRYGFCIPRGKIYIFYMRFYTQA